MFVDTAVLHSGSDASSRAGEHAHQAAQHLSRGELVPQMFGDFAAAEVFHAATSSMQAAQIRLLLEHRDFLAAVGRRASLAAAEFGGMDKNNAASIRAVWCDSTS